MEFHGVREEMKLPQLRGARDVGNAFMLRTAKNLRALTAR
jgi:hypothetical protein